MAKAEIIIIGAGIMGAMIAWQLAKKKRSVLLLDNGQGGATAAGMGHLVTIDDHPDELTLSHYSLQLWQQILPKLPKPCGWSQCGTLWLAACADEVELLEKKQHRLTQLGVTTELCSAPQLYQLEPHLATGLSGGLKIRDESIVYPPSVVAWLIEQAKPFVSVQRAQVQHLSDQQVILSSGERLRASTIIVANGIGAKTLLPELPLIGKKGQLAITERHRPLIRHQLVEIGYGASAHANSGSSIAFNIQPRPTGQLLIGSSRQFNEHCYPIDYSLLAAMLRRSMKFLPFIQQINIIRIWSGIRTATPDGLPMLGPHPNRPGVWLAVGHEGLGITTSAASAAIIEQLLHQQAIDLDHSPYLPERFLITSTL